MGTDGLDAKEFALTREEAASLAGALPATTAVGSARRQRREPFAAIPLAWAARATTATNCPKAMVWVWLIHRAWKMRSGTVAVPNGALAEYGVTRKVKNNALRQLERAGLIAVERRPRKTPVVTMLL
jgi:hypothetical protein